MAKGVANHRDGGRDPTELADSAQPANTARPVGRHTSRKYPSQPVMGGSSPSDQGLRSVRELAMAREQKYGSLFLFVTGQLCRGGYGTGAHSAFKEVERTAHVSSMARPPYRVR